MLALALVTGVSGQDRSPPPEETKQDDKPASLDDLLGLEEEEGSAEETAQQASQEELQRRLDEKQVMSVFAEAVTKMQTSADLLEEQFDPGLGTQRVQEEIIAALEALIDFAKSNQSSSSSSSSSSQQQQQQQQQQPGQRNEPQQGDQQSSSQGNPQEGDPPPGQDANANHLLEETGQEWGSLPPRIRDELLQGRREKYSSVYERLTREYYERLAEGGSDL